MNDDAIFADLVALGAIKCVGIDAKTNEKLYTFTPKIKDLMPDLYREHLNNVNHEIMVLWEKGYLDLDLFSDQPIVSITSKALNSIEIEKLSEEEQWSLNEIKRVLLSGNI